MISKEKFLELTEIYTNAVTFQNEMQRRFKLEECDLPSDIVIRYIPDYICALFNLPEDNVDIFDFIFDIIFCLSQKRDIENFSPGMSN